MFKVNRFLAIIALFFFAVSMGSCGGGGGDGGTGGGDTTAPSTPTNLTATAVSSNQIDLSWTASADNVGVAGYKIYRGGAYLKSVTTTSDSDTGLNPSTQYCYTVSAYDAAGNESGPSSQACAMTVAGGGEGSSISANLTDTCSYGKPYLLVNGTMTFGGSPCGLSSINIGGMLMMNGEFDFAADQAPFIVGLRSYNFNSTSMSGLLTVTNSFTGCSIMNATFSMNKTAGNDSCGGLTGNWSGSWNY